MVLLSLEGGSGIEERANEVHRLPVHVESGIDGEALASALAGSTIDPAHHPATSPTTRRFHESLLLESRPWS